MNRKHQFEQAYLQTTYVLKTNSYQFDLKIGRYHPAFNEWLTTHSIKTWVKMTAANPYSQALLAEENEVRNQQLNTDLFALGYITYPSEGRPENDDWQPELGFFIPNITLATALRLARKYEQNAIVYGYVNGLPQLVWV